ncbi:hypothetical protein [Leptospira alstonii]|uniref:GDSL-like protein n=2 Tax=Leptospira alstonii TaxID=28452 RepID=M6D6D7_9LEPT|nr:hypothetical protein [Leptospira alstonii]EMJ98231.1 hypothetical protein LEP1GSC194_2596 [Leptospira alstonii serovar Sichuan str. 79601]EQA81060.1 hypothetical protein LEP1GSC193_2557 [Leptospira alstonii serovar Pingchang str. 80-412]
MVKKVKWIVVFTLWFVFEVGALAAQSQRELFAKPGVIGDSLSQGFFGATVEKKTQDWAYPVLVSKQAGSSVSYNVLYGPYLNFEDILKGNCGIFCIVKSLIGGNVSTVDLPTNVGISGAQYSSVLKTSGKCDDITATKWGKEWYWAAWYWYTYRWVRVNDCKTPDKFHRFGLRNSGTQLEIMEKVKPTFLFGTAAGNYVLCSALLTSTDCLNEARFKHDIRKVMKRLAAIGSIKGGVLFTTPDLTAISYLEHYKDPQGKKNHTGLKAFYRNSVSHPGQVLDAHEVANITKFSTMLNNEVKAQGAAMGFAVADLKVVFDDLKENGRLIKSHSGWSPGYARANWPLPGQPGIFSLDGVHPNMLGHAILANELIKAINDRYCLNIHQVSEYTAWYYDSLNRNPIDLKKFLTETFFGRFISWIIGVFV